MATPQVLLEDLRGRRHRQWLGNTASATPPPKAALIIATPRPGAMPVAHKEQSAIGRHVVEGIQVNPGEDRNPLLVPKSLIVSAQEALHLRLKLRHAPTVVFLDGCRLGPVLEALNPTSLHEKDHAIGGTSFRAQVSH